MPRRSNFSGKLDSAVVQDSLVGRTIDFIWDSLIPWRKDPDRIHATAEEDLNAQFQNFLQVRAGNDFPMVHFQHEQKQFGRRRVDVSAKPTSRVMIQGITYSKYDPILVIEGKRLPAPGKDREREYVTGGEKVSGGIQRFKLGLHGGDHAVAVILAYLQKHEAEYWHHSINQWIQELTKTSPQEWHKSERLGKLTEVGIKPQKSRSVSHHPRILGNKARSIELMHFWIDCS